MSSWTFDLEYTFSVESLFSDTILSQSGPRTSRFTLFIEFCYLPHGYCIQRCGLRATPEQGAKRRLPVFALRGTKNYSITFQNFKLPADDLHLFHCMRRANGIANSDPFNDRSYSPRSTAHIPQVGWIGVPSHSPSKSGMIKVYSTLCSFSFWGFRAMLTITVLDQGRGSSSHTHPSKTGTGKLVQGL